MEELLVKSLYSSQDDILRAIIRLHTPGGIECDLTYGNGVFWRSIDRPKLCFDIAPTQPFVKRGDSRKVSLDAESISSAVFDPPFLCYVRDGKSMSKRSPELAGTATSIMSRRFGGYWAYSELADHYQQTFREVARVLKPSGVFVLKCQDIIHNHQMFCTHVNATQWAAECGLKLEDLFILTSEKRVPVKAARHGIQTQKHARIYHCYFLVFYKAKRKVRKISKCS